VQCINDLTSMPSIQSHIGVTTVRLQPLQEQNIGIPQSPVHRSRDDPADVVSWRRWTLNKMNGFWFRLIDGEFQQ
jgi:hypothetical protein